MGSNNNHWMKTLNFQNNIQLEGPGQLDSLLILNLQGIIVDLIKEPQIGFTRNEIIGQSYEIFLKNDQEKHKVRTYFELAKQGKIMCSQVAIVTKERKEKILEIINFPVIQNDQVVGVCGIVRDKTVEEELKKKVKENEEKFRVIVENSYDIVSLVDLDNRYQYVAPSHEKVLGIPPSEVEGRLTREFLNPEDIAKLNDYVETILKEENSSSPIIEIRKKNIGGQFRLLETRGVPIKDNEGLVTSILFICRDITEQREIEEAIHKNAKLNVIGELAAGIAHEIRNPLTALKGFTQMLAKDNPVYGNIMLDEIENVNSIVEELLLVSKPQAKQIELVCCNYLIAQVITFLTPESSLRNIEVTFEKSIIPEIYCVKHSIKQVVINIIKNAIDSINDEGRIHITTSQQEESILITVSDSGVGISQEKLARLGEPYYTTKEKGTGLGLMICYRIVEDHGGSLSFNSTVGQGTRVTISLPIHRG